MMLFSTLLLAHCLADFPLQTNLIITLKEKSIWGLLLHVLVHVAVTWILLGVSLYMLPLVVGLGLAHLAIDRLKYQVKAVQPVRLFIFDQIAHLACLIGATSLTVLVLKIHPSLVLPTGLLYPAMASALGLATMVLYWVWANSLQEETVERFNHLRWCRRWLLTIEQCVGAGLISFIGISTYLYR